VKKIEMLEMLSEKVSQCKKCSSLVENRKQTVFGDGPANAKVCLLAEAPGRIENSTGHVLCGPAGQLLNNILKATGLNRESVYTLNVIKCQPPNNRLPTEEECNNCRPFLELQLQIINPKYILCLGSVAAQNLLKTRDLISSLRGSWFKYKDAHVDSDVLCTYHPAFALRQGDKAKKEIFNDIQLLIEKMAKNHL
jgi:uracil-DNA glycosylase